MASSQVKAFIDWPDKNILMSKFFFSILFFLFAAGMLYGFSSCRNDQTTEHSEPPASVSDGPKGYDLTNPQKFTMPDALHEISGIAFNKGKNDTIYAEQDEEGRLFYFTPADKNTSSTKFGKHGDYEDIAINKSMVIMLRSDGVLFTFPLAETTNKKITSTKEWDALLPAGEYEGIAAGLDGNLIVMCKNCPDDDQSKEVSAFLIRQDGSNSLTVLKHFKINIGAVHLSSEKKRVKFHPSCLAQHPFTHDWYVISSVNKELLLFDESWKVKAAYALDPRLFKQPEGLAFDVAGNMYISNEGGESGSGNILKFMYKK